MKQVSEKTGICFLRVERTSRLRAFLSAADLSPLPIALDAVLIDEWLYRGCVYVDGRRTRTDVDLPAGAVLRIHTRPKRYHGRFSGPLRARILEDRDGFLVVDKPSGLPTHATLDNSVDNVKFLLEQELGIPLYTTHRLDIPTSGRLILAKSPTEQARINKLFAKGRVTKIYEALSWTRVEPGEYTHYLNPETHVPREITTEIRVSWWECRMSIEQVDPAGSQWRHRIRLHTGKTHQIRAQMAALGGPLIGDVLYGGEPAEDFGLRCVELVF